MIRSAHLTRRQQRFTALLAAFVLFAGQLLFQQHVHADDLPESSCVVCLQVDHTPVTHAAAPTPGALLVTSVGVDQRPLCAVSGITQAYRSRAPPAS